MDDYIKRADAINYIHENQCSSCSDVGLCGNCAVVISLKMLEKVPTADVRENVRGKWIVENFTERFLTCPFCHEVYKRRGLFNFCPNCGADMRGEKYV